jgi:DNA-binding response OmpR family regulator
MSELPAAAPRVLLLDQDVALRQALCFSLPLDGYRVEAFGDPDRFSDHLDLAAHDAVIIGHAPPAIHAAPLVERIRSKDQASAILLTATHPTADLVRLAKRHRALLVEKPLLEDSLLQALQSALAR